MKETQRHKDAFEYYYALGYKRSCPQVGRKFAVSDNSAKKWHKAFNWSERIMLRDTKISKNVEKKILKVEEDSRVRSYTKILELRDTLLAAVGTAFYKDDGDGITKLREDIEIHTARELRDVAIGALKCETEALHIISPEPIQEPSTVIVAIKSVRELPDKN